MTARFTRPVLLAAPLLALGACALPAPQQATRSPVQTFIAGPTSTNQGTPPYAQLIPFENSMGIVQTRNSLPPGAE